MEKVILFCDECGWQGTEDEARKAPDLHERHDIGTPYSYVECPNFARHDEYGDRLCCGPLVYPVDCRHIYPYIAADDVEGWSHWLNKTIGADNLARLHDRLHAPIKPSSPLI